MKDKVITEARKIICKQLGEIARSNNITQEEIAGRLGMKQSSVSRIFSGRYSPTLDTILAICRVVSANIFIEEKNGNSDMAKIMRDRLLRQGDNN